MDCSIFTDSYHYQRMVSVREAQIGKQYVYMGNHPGIPMKLRLGILFYKRFNELTPDVDIESYTCRFEELSARLLPHDLLLEIR